MKHVLGVAGYIFFLFLMSACGQEEEEINLTDFRYDIVTCRHDGVDLVFLRDDTTLLYPQSAVSSDLLPYRLFTARENRRPAIEYCVANLYQTRNDGRYSILVSGRRARVGR